MTLPTLTHKQYHALVNERISSPDEMVPIWWLVGLEPDILFTEDWELPESRGLQLQFLNVTEPHLYHAHTGQRVTIMPYLEPPTYDGFDAVWPAEKSPWAYVIKDNLYDEIGESSFYFKNGQDLEDGNVPLAKFNLKDGSTH